MKKSGFTLVELLVVVSIISILAVVGLVIFFGTQSRARDATRKSDLKTISEALELSFNDKTSQYQALQPNMFAKGEVPQDPLNGFSLCSNRICKYCVRSQIGECGSADPTVGTAMPDTGRTYRICTNLEGGGYFSSN